MTSDFSSPQDGEGTEGASQPPEPEQTREGPLAATGEMFSSGEGMVAFGAILILLSYVIFEVFLDEYSITTVAIVLAIVAAVLPRLNRESVEKIASLPVLMKAVGYLIAIAGLTEIIFDVESAIFEGVPTVIAALAAYGGYALAFLGARAIET
jgi:hypothetical protein